MPTKEPPLIEIDPATALESIEQVITRLEGRYVIINGQRQRAAERSDGAALEAAQREAAALRGQLLGAQVRRLTCKIALYEAQYAEAQAQKQALEPQLEAAIAARRAAEETERTLRNQLQGANAHDSMLALDIAAARRERADLQVLMLMDRPPIVRRRPAARTGNRGVYRPPA